MKIEKLLEEKVIDIIFYLRYHLRFVVTMLENSIPMIFKGLK